MIKAIIFDYGNVIETVDRNMFLKGLAGKHTDKTVHQLDELIYGSELLLNYEKGLLTSEEMFKKVVRMCGLSISKQEFEKVFTSICKPIPSTIRLIRKLKKNYKIGILSNTNELCFKNIIMVSEIFPLFDAVTVSYKLKSMKPEKIIFNDIINKLKLAPQECVFIDDMAEYAEAACKSGIKGIHYTTHKRLIEKLKKYGIS